MADIKLDIAFWNYDRTSALAEGKVKIDGVAGTFYTAQIVTEIFEGMIGERKFDISELGMTYFLRTFKDGKSPFVAIPVFPNRAFRHAAVYINKASGITKPTDLNGKTIGELALYSHDAGLIPKGTGDSPIRGAATRFAVPAVRPAWTNSDSPFASGAEVLTISEANRSVAMLTTNCPVALMLTRVEIVEADLHAHHDIVRACEGASCVVSTLLGLHGTLIDAQGALLDAAVAAGVPRFIPSDYAMDFNKVAPGLNPNFDLHREFKKRLDRASIRSTSILNGAFMNLLTGEAPLVLFKIHRVLYWGQNPNQPIDFTTMDDTAAFTAEAALDPDAPPILRIAGEQISAAGLAAAASQVSGKPFHLLRGGSLNRLQRILSAVDVVFKTRTSRPSAPTGIRSVSTGMGGSKRRRTCASS